MLSVEQGGIKYHFFSLWYDLTWDWTPVFQTISKSAKEMLMWECCSCWQTIQSGLPCLSIWETLPYHKSFLVMWQGESGESTSLTNRTWEEQMLGFATKRQALVYIPDVRRISGFHLFAVWTFLYVPWIHVTLVFYSYGVQLDALY